MSVRYRCFDCDREFDDVPTGPFTSRRAGARLLVHLQRQHGLALDEAYAIVMDTIYPENAHWPDERVALTAAAGLFQDLLVGDAP